MTDGGLRPARRAVSGILLLDKPEGLGSNAALQIVKRLFRARKAGHTGSLDVPASGLLPVCLGEATKVCGFLLEAPKHYRAVIRFGVRTTTGDAQGAVIESRPTTHLGEADLRAVLDRFRGTIDQIPPMYSALKRNGRPLHELAYAGLEIERQARPVQIHALELRWFENPCAEVEIRCSKGTYVRTLAEDLGAALGCGGSVASLRRLGVGPYQIEDSVTLDTLEVEARAGLEHLDRWLRASDESLSHLPEIYLGAEAARALVQGQAVFVPAAPGAGLVRLYSAAAFLGVGTVLDDGRVAPRRLMNVA